MSITDELRRYAQVHDLIERESLLVLADRIDKALEEGYIELPRDADGRSIRIGETLEGYCKTIEIAELRNDGAWHLVDVYGIEWDCHEAFAHVRPDSWERIIEDAMEAYQFDDGSSEPSIGSLVERCKRLAGDGA